MIIAPTVENPLTSMISALHIKSVRHTAFQEGYCRGNKRADTHSTGRLALRAEIHQSNKLSWKETLFSRLFYSLKSDISLSILHMIRPWILRNAGASRRYRHWRQFEIGDQARHHSLPNRHVTSVSRTATCRPPNRRLQTSAVTTDVERVPLRKQLKDEAKALKSKGISRRGNGASQRNDDWELTVGIEIHAQLNTEAKLFSSRWSSYV